jgi:enamine deaminase RidA (YjgF/YER057c/UK114 family)
VFVSGFTSEADTLEKQVRQVVADLNGALKAASSSVDRIVTAAVFLQRNHSVKTAETILSGASGLGTDAFEFELVDGFARDKGLLEVEVTALTESERRTL